MEEFKRFLYTNKLKTSTVEEYVKDVKRFASWCKIENIQIDKVTYNQSLSYIDYLHKQGVSKSVINNYLKSIRKYFDYLIPITEDKRNPFQHLRLKHLHKPTKIHTLDWEKLAFFYDRFQQKEVWKFREEKSVLAHHRTVVMLGILIFQGVQIQVFNSIEVQHINFQKATIYIPSTTRSNARVLPLHAKQMLTLQRYVYQLPKEQVYLIAKPLESKIHTLQRLLTSIGLKTQDIRPNVIMNWLKTNNIRQVQYLAGHRYISSTERYKQADIRDLQSALELFHPMQS